jgi:hypothetical protein
MVTSVAADLGYTVATLWDGILGDDATLTPSDIVDNAEKYCVSHNIVIATPQSPAGDGRLS